MQLKKKTEYLIKIIS